MEKYTVALETDESGLATVKRVRDGKTARCKMSWLRAIGNGDYVPKSRTKALRVDGLDWE